MGLGRLLTLVKKHPYWTCTIIVLLASLVEQFNPLIFEQLNLYEVRFLSALILVGMALTGFGYKERIEDEEDNQGEHRELD